MGGFFAAVFFVAGFAGSRNRPTSINRNARVPHFEAARRRRFAHEGAIRAGDREGAAVWRRITRAVIELANKTPSGPLH